MRRLPIHVALVLTLLATIVPVANAQTYLDYIFPLPAKTPKTEANCTTCSASDNKKTMVGYQGAISSFTGRYVDSAFDGEGFTLPRPLRAWQMKYDASHDRLYLREGSYLVGYTLSNLITRLSSNEALIKLDRPSDSGPAGRYLKWDKAFNIEDEWPPHAGDGGDWLPDFDFDNRGHLYVAGGQFWGLLTDDYGTGPAFDSGNAQPGNSYTEIMSVQTADGHYYAIVGDERSLATVYDVTTPPGAVLPGGTGPTPLRTLNFAWTKTAVAKTSDNHWVALIGTDQVLKIFTAEAISAGRPSTFTTTRGLYGAVTTDGTNFYAAQAVAGRLVISVFSQVGGTFVETQYPTTAAFTPERMQYGAGYLSLAGQSMVNNVSAQDIRLFRVGSGTMTELDLLAYRKNSTAAEPYIVSCCSAAAPTGYIRPSYGLAFDSIVYKKNSKTYLVVNLKGLGDVYEIKGSDSITAANKGIIGTPNPNSGQTGSGPFYGDKVLFGSTTSAASPMNVVWNFGNPEAADNATTTTTGIDVDHQYSGVTSTAQLSGARSVTVTNAADSSINDTLQLNLAVPTPRVAIVGQSSTASIVTSDQWKDASDGTVEGHFSSWNIDGTVTKALPSATVPVGDCTAHTLNFTANYGPYTGSGSTLASVNGTLALTVAPITYTPKPFVAVVNAPTSNGNNVTFTSGSRVTTDTAIVPAATSFTWQWDLLDGATSLQTATGTSTFGQVPSFVVPSATFTGKTGLKARLQLSTAATLPGTCANSTSSTGLVNVPNAPDPQISLVTGCQYAGSPCTYKVISKSGADTSGWSVSWSFNPGNVTGGTGITFSPSFSSSYSGTLTASVTNAIGSGSDSTTVSIATALCGATLPTQGDIVIQYFGTSGTCGIGSNCSVNEKITFAASGSYKFNANCDVYNWDFGDGASATTLRATHTYTGNNQTYHGKFTVTVNNANGSVTLQYPFTVTIGTSSVCTVNCNPCPQITSQSAFVYFAGASGCSYVSTQPCQPGELVNLQVSPYLGSGYNFSCGTHTFSWSFGDGSTGSGQQVTHSFQSGGTYPVSVTVNSPTGSMQFPVTVIVAGGSVCLAPSTSNSAITLSGGTSGCSAANPNCRVSENISMNVAGLNGFSFSSCNSTTFVWDFGDGSDPATGQTVSHAYSGAQSQYTARVTVTNELGAVTLTQLVKVSGGSCPAPTSGNAFLTYSGPTSNCSYLSTAVPCGANEAITFSANADSSTGYRFSCGTHTFLWNFDDGSTSSDRVPTHAFVQQRTYHVTCTITNGTGTVTLPLSIAVGGGGVTPQIEVGFAYEPVSGAPTLIKFTPSVTPANSVSSWKWDFGDGTDPVTISGTSTVPQYHQYASTGTYTVTLTTNGGSVTKQIIVGTPPPPRPRPGRH